MARYLCQRCNTVVQYGEIHHCFIDKNEDHVYMVPQPDVSKETERNDENSDGIHACDWNKNNGNTTQKNEREECNETNSLPNESNERIGAMPPSRRQIIPSFFLSSEFLRFKKNRQLESKSESSSDIERRGNKVAAKNQKNCRERKSASDEVLQIGGSSSGERATESKGSGSASDPAVVSVAGPSGIRTHIRRDGKEKPHVCNVCGKAFAKRFNLKQHERTHTGEKPFVCKTCGKGCAQQGDLTKLLRTHTGEKPFVCEFCGKRFARKDVLDRHRLTHTGEKPHKCKFCDAKFRDKSSCTKHQKREHGGME